MRGLSRRSEPVKRLTLDWWAVLSALAAVIAVKAAHLNVGW